MRQVRSGLPGLRRRLHAAGDNVPQRIVIQREQAATGVVQQTWIAIDEAPTKMRRMLQRMLDAERAQAQP